MLCENSTMTVQRQPPLFVQRWSALLILLLTVQATSLCGMETNPLQVHTAEQRMARRLIEKAKQEKTKKIEHDENDDTDFIETEETNLSWLQRSAQWAEYNPVKAGVLIAFGAAIIGTACYKMHNTYTVSSAPSAPQPQLTTSSTSSPAAAATVDQSVSQGSRPAALPTTSIPAEENFQIIPYDTSQHAQAIKKILQSTGLEGQSLEYWVCPVELMELQLQSRSNVGHVLITRKAQKTQDTVAGFMVCNESYWKSTKYWYIAYLALDQAFRAKGRSTSTTISATPGLARLLYEQAKRDAVARKLPIMLNTLINNTAMQRFCERIGMTEASRSAIFVYYINDRHLPIENVARTEEPSTLHPKLTQPSVPTPSPKPLWGDYATKAPQYDKSDTIELFVKTLTGSTTVLSVAVDDEGWVHAKDIATALLSKYRELNSSPFQLLNCRGEIVVRSQTGSSRYGTSVKKAWYEGSGAKRLQFVMCPPSGV